MQLGRETEEMWGWSCQYQGHRVGKTRPQQEAQLLPQQGREFPCSTEPSTVEQLPWCSL